LEPVPTAALSASVATAVISAMASNDVQESIRHRVNIRSKSKLKSKVEGKGEQVMTQNKKIDMDNSFSVADSNLHDKLNLSGQKSQQVDACRDHSAPVALRSDTSASHRGPTSHAYGGCSRLQHQRIRQITSSAAPSNRGIVTKHFAHAATTRSHSSLGDQHKQYMNQYQHQYGGGQNNHHSPPVYRVNTSSSVSPHSVPMLQSHYIAGGGARKPLRAESRFAYTPDKPQSIQPMQWMHSQLNAHANVIANTNTNTGSKAQAKGGQENVDGAGLQQLHDGVQGIRYASNSALTPDSAAAVAISVASALPNPSLIPNSPNSAAGFKSAATVSTLNGQSMQWSPSSSKSSVDSNVQNNNGGNNGFTDASVHNNILAVSNPTNSSFRQLNPSPALQSCMRPSSPPASFLPPPPAALSLLRVISTSDDGHEDTSSNVHTKFSSRSTVLSLQSTTPTPINHSHNLNDSNTLSPMNSMKVKVNTHSLPTGASSPMMATLPVKGVQLISSSTSPNDNARTFGGFVSISPLHAPLTPQPFLDSKTVSNPINAVRFSSVSDSPQPNRVSHLDQLYQLQQLQRTQRNRREAMISATDDSDNCANGDNLDNTVNNDLNVKISSHSVANQQLIQLDNIPDLDGAQARRNREISEQTMQRLRHITGKNDLRFKSASNASRLYSSSKQDNVRKLVYLHCGIDT
jgi:hypothetical protein